MAEENLWAKCFMTNILKIHSLNLKTVHIAVFNYLLAKTSYHNRIDIETQEDVANALSLTLSYVNKAFRALEECNIIIKTRNNNYYMNTNILDVNSTAKAKPQLNKPLLKLQPKHKATAQKPLASAAFDDVPADFLIN